ncbi:MAG: oligoendopeptidase F [Anaerolineales bacterium]|nr:oligoendopeptidase F [Anaerolineales bacterium]
MPTTQRLPARKDVPKESTWNSEALFKDWSAWRTELEAARQALPALSAFAGKLGAGPDTLADWLDAYQEQAGRLIRLQIYVRMSSAVDSGDATAKSALGQLMAFSGEFNAAAAFARPEMLALGGKLLEWADTPRLQVYRHYFDNLLRQGEHTRSEEVEAIMGMLEDIFGSIANTASELTDSDLKFADAVDSQGQQHAVAQSTVTPTGIQSPDRQRRRTAWENFCDAHLGMKNTLASNYLAHVKASIFQAKVRGYASVLELRLKPYNLPLEVFYNLIEVFKARLPVWHRYWQAKRKILGVDALHPYDIWAPVVEAQPQVSFHEAVDWISAALAPLGAEYAQTIRRGCLEERWVDYAQNAGKRQGAFSNRSFGNFPYIFTTFNGSLMAMSVLAHELGHSMHAYMAAQRQPGVYRDYNMMSSSITETASNFHQAMTRAYLLQAKASDANFQIALIDEAMFNFHRYFFQMPTLARFELEVYTRAEQGKPLNADILNGIMASLYAEGYGESMSDDPERSAITWAEFVHLYMPFYTFQYAVGVSAAHALAEGVRNSPQAARNYLDFLGAGASLYPIDLFKLAGVDMSTPEPVEKTFDVLAGLVDRLDKLTT